MPKQNKPPKYCKNGKYAVVYVNGKKHYLGLYGSPESRQEYARLIAEWDTKPIPHQTKSESDVSINELAAAFLDHFESRQDKTEFTHNKSAIGYAVNIYGTLPANEFSPKKLKVVRSQMVKAGTLCRRMVNRYVGKIRMIFTWGGGEEIVQSNVSDALKAVRDLRKGEEGTHDNPPRKPVPVDAVRRTLPGASPTVAAIYPCFLSSDHNRYEKAGWNPSDR
jgi:hypothetical protein